MYTCVCMYSHIYGYSPEIKFRIPPMHQTTLFVLSIFLKHFSGKPSTPIYFVYTLFHSCLLLQ